MLDYTSDFHQRQPGKARNHIPLVLAASLHAFSMSSEIVCYFFLFFSDHFFKKFFTKRVREMQIPFIAGLIDFIPPCVFHEGILIGLSLPYKHMWAPHQPATHTTTIALWVGEVESAKLWMWVGEREREDVESMWWWMKRSTAADKGQVIFSPADPHRVRFKALQS